MSDTKPEDNQLEPIVNKVAQSGLITINLEDYIAKKILEIDLKDFLFKELILKEKLFKEKLKATDWSMYANQSVAIYCSTDALIQQWAYMLLAKELAQVQAQCYVGTIEQVKEKILLNNIENLSVDEFIDKRVMVRGCGHETISDAAFFAITQKLFPVVKSLMYGEACSNVPIFKKKN